MAKKPIVVVKKQPRHPNHFLPHKLIMYAWVKGRLEVLTEFFDDFDRVEDYLGKYRKRKHDKHDIIYDIKVYDIDDIVIHCEHPGKFDDDDSYA